jgi:Ca2+-binding EF-hand superfamily protein
MNTKDISHLINAAVILLFLAAIPAAALAQDNETTDQTSRFIDRFDADGDGQLSLEEFPGPDERFSQLDTDGDGFLSREELRKTGRRGNKN